MSEFNQARREGKIKFGYDFSTLAEVTHLWGLKAKKLPYRVCFRIPGKENALCCLLSEQGGNGWKNVPHYGTKMDSRGWREILRIDEYNEDNDIFELAMVGGHWDIVRRVENAVENPQERYVFWRESREGVQWYKFYGVFEIDKDATIAAFNHNTAICIYRRKSEEGVCPKSDVLVKSISDVEVTGLKGKILEANLMDEVPYELKIGDGMTGEVKVWPGQRFWVKEASETSPCLVCQTADADLLRCPKEDETFFISRRDLELGYFKVVGDGTLEDTRKGQ